MAPDQPVAPITTNDGVNVVVSWVAPDNRGATISSYTITLRQSDELTFSEDTIDCDGTNSDIVANL